MKSTNSPKPGRSPSAAAGVPCREISRAGTPAAALGDLPGFGEFVDFIGLPEVRAAEQRYTTEDPSARSGR